MKWFVEKSDACQRFTPLSHQHTEPLHSSTIPWFFMKGEMNIYGHFHEVPIKAETFTRIPDRDVMKFLWKHIIFQFRMPKEVVTDNGAQFISFDLKIFAQSGNSASFFHNEVSCSQWTGEVLK